RAIGSSRSCTWSRSWAKTATWPNRSPDRVGLPQRVKAVSTPIEVALPPDRAPRATRLPLRYGVAAVLAAFLLAQLFGALASNVANAVMRGGSAAHGGAAAE